jgi:N-glycosylase/DNA lyase
MPEKDEWRCVLRGQIFCLKQDPSYLYYRTLSHRGDRSAEFGLHTPPSSTSSSRSEETAISIRLSSPVEEPLAILSHYLNLSSNLTDLYSEWSTRDSNFRKKAPKFTGIRILRQDAWEALICFICSSNNNIARISQMVEKLCTHYGPFIGKIDGYAYHDFPTPEALTGDEVELQLRGLGFGYRAKYIYQSAKIVAREREDGWLDSLRNPENPALGVEARPGSEMSPEGRDGYRTAHEKLLELPGVGPKVADCVCLMGLGWREAVPVDTHGK